MSNVSSIYDARNVNVYFVSIYHEMKTHQSSRLQKRSVADIPQLRLRRTASTCIWVRYDLEVVLKVVVCARGVSEAFVLVRSRSCWIRVSYTINTIEGVVQCAKRFPVELAGEAVGSQDNLRALVLRRQTPSTSSTMFQPSSRLSRPGGAVCRDEAAGDGRRGG